MNGEDVKEHKDGMPPPPALFPREKFSGYTDNQVKYIRIGWNAAMRSDGVAPTGGSDGR